MKIIASLLLTSIIAAYGFTNVKVYNEAMTLIESYKAVMRQASTEARRTQLCASTPPPCLLPPPPDQPGNPNPKGEF